MSLSPELHLFIQSCISRGAMSEKTAKVIYNKCLQVNAGNDDDALDYAEAVNKINDAIESFGFSIKRTMDEHSGRPWIAFVNTKDDEMAKVATEYSPQDISYFRILIRLILRSGKRYAISDIDARRAGEKAQPKFTPSQAEAVLATFVAKGWLIIVNARISGKNKAMYQLSVRSRLELEHYLREEYPRQMSKDFECPICDEIVMKGRECCKPNCQTRLHDYCSIIYAQRNQHIQGGAVCSKCRSPWRDDTTQIIGPAATDTRDVGSSSDSDHIEAGLGDENNLGYRASPSHRGDDARRGRSEEDDEAQPGPSISRRTSKTNGASSVASSRRGSGIPRSPPPDSAPSDSTRRVVAKPESDEEENVDQLNEQDETDDDDDDDINARRRASKKNEQAKKAKAKQRS